MTKAGPPEFVWRWYGNLWNAIRNSPQGGLDTNSPQCLPLAAGNTYTNNATIAAAIDGLRAQAANDTRYRLQVLSFIANFCDPTIRRDLIALRDEANRAQGGLQIVLDMNA